MKKYAEINGKFWEAAYPFCAGCPELTITGAPGGECAYEGNGCRFPEMRTKQPINIYAAFHALCRKLGKSSTDVARELGNCIE